MSRWTNASVWMSLLKLLGSLLLLPAGITYWHVSVRWINAIGGLELVQVRLHSWVAISTSAATEIIFPANMVSGLYRRDRTGASYSRVMEMPPLNGNAMQVAVYVQKATAVLQSPSSNKWTLAQSSDFTHWVLMSSNKDVVAVSEGGTVCGAYYRGDVDGRKAKAAADLAATVVCLAPSANEHEAGGRKNKEDSDTTTQLRKASRLHSLSDKQTRRRLQSQQASPLVEALYETPATSFLIALNCVLYFMYWNHRVDPASVALSYTRLVHRGEAWRCLSGATAHFEIWHLGFNMVCLYALGNQLEGTGMYSSISFFLLNLSLILVTKVVWCMLQYGQSMYRRQRNGNATPNTEDEWTVGYSGVLFAWMVVAALNQSATCPIPFLPQLCFRTYVVAGMVFSFAPLVQLAVAQLILPRVSFSGHLAGLLVGYVLHWGLLPMKVLHPAILIPLLYYCYLKYIRNIIPGWKSTFMHAFIRGRGLYVWTMRAFAAILVHSATRGQSASAWALLPSVFGLLFWASSCGSTETVSDASDRREPLSRAFIFVAVIVLVDTSMAFGANLAIPGASTTIPSFLSIIRFTLLFGGGCCACEKLHEYQEGIFWRTLGYTTIEPGRQLGKLLIQRFSSRQQSIYLTDEGSDRRQDWAPFTGRGRVLGSAAPTSDAGPMISQV
ncbi:hypothetical protein MPSEU_000017600 [Mayamaea pseudoterrestris]|nr:hypothetical protein MPSEU_000017600 [Mayamaea pseudoterrestris]